MSSTFVYKIEYKINDEKQWKAIDSNFDDIFNQMTFRDSIHWNGSSYGSVDDDLSNESMECFAEDEENYFIKKTNPPIMDWLAVKKVFRGNLKTILNEIENECIHGRLDSYKHIALLFKNDEIKKDSIIFELFKQYGLMDFDESYTMEKYMNSLSSNNIDCEEFIKHITNRVSDSSIGLTGFYTKKFKLSHLNHSKWINNEEEQLMVFAYVPVYSNPDYKGYVINGVSPLYIEDIKELYNEKCEELNSIKSKMKPKLGKIGKKMVNELSVSELVKVLNETKEQTLTSDYDKEVESNADEFKFAIDFLERLKSSLYYSNDYKEVDVRIVFTIM